MPTWDKMTYAQRTYRGLDAERNPADLAQICAAIAEIRAAKAARGESNANESERVPTIYRYRPRVRRRY
jgi:hypothetical protein